MDPLASVKEFRQQETTKGRTLTVAPPPTIPMTPPAAPVDTPPEPAADNLDPSGELDLTGPGAGPAPAADGAADAAADTTDVVDDADLPGMPRGRKRLIHVNLPGDTRQRLEAGRQRHGTFGVAVMAALRGSYEWIVAQHTPEPVEPVGPFPAPRPPKRRLVVPDARLKPFYVDPEEAKGIETLAEQCELSVSELVTIAIDKFYGEGDPLPPGSSQRDRAKK